MKLRVCLGACPPHEISRDVMFVMYVFFDESCEEGAFLDGDDFVGSGVYEFG